MGSESEWTGPGVLEDEATLRAKIAELESTVASLREERQLFRRVFIENPLPCIAYDANNLQILEANDSATSLYGYAAEEILRLDLLALFSAAEQRRRNDLLIELGRPINNIGPFTHVSATGQELVVSLVSFS